MKRNFKSRILAIMMTFALVFLCIPAVPGGADAYAKDTKASETGQSSEFGYTKGSDGNITLTSYNGDGGNVKIPSTIDGKKVTKIGDECFRGNAYIKTVEMPDSITAIGDYAFEACGAMTAVTFSSKLKSIGKGAFSGCAKLGEITVPESTESIGEGAFLYCMEVKTLKVSGSISEIGQFAFAGMEALEEVKLEPDADLALPDRLFCNCNSLKEVKVSGVSSVGKRAFSGCGAVESIDLEGPLTSVGDYAFEKCYSIEELSLRGSDVVLGSSILKKSLGYNNREGCSLVLGSNVTFSKDTFNDAAIRSLKLTADTDRLILIEDGVKKACTVVEGMLFTDEGKTLLMVFPDSVTKDSEGKSMISVPEKTERIADNAFSGLYLSSLHLPESLRIIESRAFSNCIIRDVSLGSDNENGTFVVENNALYENIGSAGTATDGAAAKDAIADGTVTDETASEEAVSDGADAKDAIADETAADEPAADETVKDGAATDEPAASEAATDDSSANEAATDGPAVNEEIVNEAAAKEAAVNDPETLYRLIRFCRQGKDEVIFIIPDNVAEIAPYAFCGCGVNTIVRTAPKSSSKLNKICDNAFTYSGLISKDDPYYDFFSEMYGVFMFDDSWTAEDIKALDYDQDKAFENRDYFNPPEEEENADDASDETVIPDRQREDSRYDDYRYDESDGYNRPRREDEVIIDDPDDDSGDKIVYTSLSGEKSLFEEAKFSSFMDTHSSFRKWSEEYLKYNSDNHYVDLSSSEIVPYTMLYKGEQHYRTMACVLNDDEYKKEHSIREIGDDYHDMYLMMDHGLFAEIERCRMPNDIILYSGITTERAAQMAGKGKNDEYTTQDLINSIGSYYTDAAMMSTTASGMIASSFSSHSNTMVIIYASKSAIDEVGAINIDCMDSMFRGEEEILLSNDAKYRILDVGTLSVGRGDYGIERTCIKLELIGKNSAADKDEDEMSGDDKTDPDADNDNGGSDGSDKKGKHKKSNKPDTGDRGYGFYLTMFFISSAAFFAVLAGRRRGKKQE